jgi:uncharacterized surface protein with fasciclin (FAS1) repeats
VKQLSTTILTAALGLSLAMTSPSQAQSQAPAPSAGQTQTQDIVDVAAGNKDFTALVAAIKAAGLVETLKGKGPFTVFAPTDDAFKKLPAATLDGLLKPESKDKLASILKYHVVAGSYDAARLSKAKVKVYGVKSVQGSDVTINLNKGVVVSGATVTQPDIKAGNGIIHAIDTVILPPKIKAAMRASEMKEKAAASASELKAKAAEAAASAKAKAAEMAAKAKNAIGKSPPATSPGSTSPGMPSQRP